MNPNRNTLEEAGRRLNASQHPASDDGTGCSPTPEKPNSHIATASAPVLPGVHSDTIVDITSRSILAPPSPDQQRDCIPAFDLHCAPFWMKNARFLPHETSERTERTENIERTEFATAIGGGGVPNASLVPFFSYNFARRSRSAFAITDTELNVMAALAKIGCNSRPTKG